MTTHRPKLFSKQLPPISTSRTRLPSQFGDQTETDRFSRLKDDSLTKHLISLTNILKLRPSPKVPKRRLNIIPNTFKLDSDVKEEIKLDRNFEESRIDPRLNSSIEKISVVNASIISILNEQIQRDQDKKTLQAKRPKNIGDQIPIMEAKQYLKPYHMTRFTQFNLDFPHYSALGKQKSVVKNVYDQSIKQSSNLLLRSIVWEFDQLTKEFNKVDNQKEILFQMISTEEPDLDLNIVLESLLPINELHSYSMEQLYQYMVKILQNKIDHVQEMLFDVLFFMFKLMKNKILQTRSVNLYFQICFVMCAFCESFGHVSKAVQILEQLVLYSNIYQLYQLKIQIYFRLASCLNKQSQHVKALSIGKKLLQLTWYYENYEYELRSYQVISLAQRGLGELKNSISFYERYINHQVQQDGYIRQLGVKYTKAQIKKRQMVSSTNSFSQDDFDIDLVISQDKAIEKTDNKHPETNSRFHRYTKSSVNLVGQKQFLKPPKNDCDLCAMYINNQRVETNQKVYFKQDCQVMNHQSFSRNFANYFSEKALHCKTNNQIQQLYKPDQTVPILIRLFQHLMNNYRQKYGTFNHSISLDTLQNETYH